MKVLTQSGGDHVIQAFPLTKGMIGLTTGTYNEISLVHCAADGDITITWSDASTDTISMLAGEDFGISSPKATITVDSGEFHLA